MIAIGESLRMGNLRRRCLGNRRIPYTADLPSGTVPSGHQVHPLCLAGMPLSDIGRKTPRNAQVGMSKSLSHNDFADQLGGLPHPEKTGRS